MTKTYQFKTTEEGIDTKSRIIVATEETLPGVIETEFTLEQKENQLVALKEQKVNNDKQIAELETEITAIKNALSIK